MQIWERFRPNRVAISASMNSAGLPTTVGSWRVDPLIAPTMAPLPAHSCASVRCVRASVLVAMKWQPGFSEMQSVAYWILK